MKFRYDKNTEELVVSAATRIEYHQISLWLTRKVKGWRFMPAVKAGVWDGNQTYFKNGRVNLGLWKECVKGCQEIGASFILENKEDFPINRDVTLEKVQDFCKDFFKYHKVKNKAGEMIPFMPYEHQIESAYKILKNRYCMAEVATSGGKSLIISIVIFYTLKYIDPTAKFLLIVPSITLVTQFYDNILEYNFGANNLAEMREKKIDSLNGEDYQPCLLRIEEVMSDRPRKYSGTENPNIYIGTYQSLEKWPKTFFQQFHTVACDEAHGAKAKTILSILEKTFKTAYSRFGVSGTFPVEDSCEILTIQSVLGPKITEVSAHQLKEKGIITPMEIKVLMMNHNDKDFEERIDYIKKHGMGKEALDLEKDYIHISEKRLDMIRKIIDKCDKNTLVLFHSIEYGQQILNKLKNECQNKDFYYIDGEVRNKQREEIKVFMEETTEKVEYTILNFGDYQIECESNFNILLSDGNFKLAKDITQEDDIDDKFIEKYKKN
jgi:superfamily II DNA or RNA helicase